MTSEQRIIDADKAIGPQKLHLNNERLNFEAALRHIGFRAFQDTRRIKGSEEEPKK